MQNVLIYILSVGVLWVLWKLWTDSADVPFSVRLKLVASAAVALVLVGALMINIVMRVKPARRLIPWGYALASAGATLWVWHHYRWYPGRPIITAMAVVVLALGGGLLALVLKWTRPGSP